MIRPVTRSFVGYKANDWYLIDFESAKSLFYEAAGGLAHIPGVRDFAKALADRAQGKPGEVIVHRTHLPLLTSPEALALLTTQKPQDWVVRDRWADSLGFKPRVTQHQAVDFIVARRGTLLADDMRLGKGHPVGTKILTPSGWTRIEHLQVGDQVVGSDGLPCRVTGLFDRGILPVFKVTFSDKTSVYVDGDHLWQAWDHNAWHQGGQPKVVETRALAGDLKYSNGNRKWRIPLVKPIAFDERELKIDPYVLGVLLGDGSMTHGTVSFVPGDELVPREASLRLPNDVELRSTESETRATCWRICALDGKHNPVLDELQALGLQGKKSPEKFVPELYLFSSVTQRISILQGLMDTDGEWSAGLLGFSSSSKQLARDVKFLVESLGGIARESFKERPTYTYKGEKRIGLPSHKLTISLPEGIFPFRTRSGYQPHQKFVPARHFESIELAGHASVFCISVDASDQLYVTENCIVTHNTLTCLMAHDPARGPLVIAAPLSTRAVWLGWIRRVFPGVPVGILTGTKKVERERLERPIVFCHYDILKHWQSAMKIGTLVYDEAHLLVNRKTERGKAAALVSSRAEMMIAATGTPVWAMPPDLWNIIGMLSPAAWGGYYDFGMRYGAPEHNGYGVEFKGVTNEEELNARLSEVKIRRQWADVSKDLPPISRNIVVSEVDEPTSRRLDILAAKLKKERTNTAANLALYRSQLCKVKLKTVVREAKQIMDRGEPVVIWTWHKEFAIEIAEALDAFLIHGDVSPNKREDRMMAWKQEPSRALVATMAVAQAGIDLSHAHLAIFAEIDYVPTVLGQAEMRTYSPDKSMNITFVVANHVVDQRIVRSLIMKLNAADPLGFGAAVDAIDALRESFEGPRDDPDMDRFLDDILAANFEVV